MSPTRGLALDSLVRQAVGLYPTCGAVLSVLAIPSTIDRPLDRFREALGDAVWRLDRVADAEPPARGGPEATARGGGDGDGCPFAIAQAVALTTAVLGVLAGDGTHLDQERYWRHCVAVGVLSRLAAERGIAEVDRAFPAGFFYPLGRLLFDRLSPDRFGEALALQREVGLDVNSAERRAIGVTEAELGAEVAWRWGFPVWLVDAIAHPRTHDSVPSRHRSTFASVFPARLTAEALGFHTEVEATATTAPPLRWLIDPVLLRLEARGGAEWVTTRVDEILQRAWPGDWESTPA